MHIHLFGGGGVWVPASTSYTKVLLWVVSFNNKALALILQCYFTEASPGADPKYLPIQPAATSHQNERLQRKKFPRDRQTRTWTRPTPGSTVSWPRSSSSRRWIPILSWKEQCPATNQKRGDLWGLYQSDFRELDDDSSSQKLCDLKFHMLCVCCSSVQWSLSLTLWLIWCSGTEQQFSVTEMSKWCVNYRKFWELQIYCSTVKPKFWQPNQSESDNWVTLNVL